MTTPGNRDVLILGFGAQTPIGRTWPSSMAAARSGLSGYSEHPYMRDQYGERMIVARVPWLEASTALEDRVVSLAGAAAREALAAMDLARIPRIRLHLALPTESVVSSATADRIADAVLACVKTGRPEMEVAFVRAGHAGGFAALATAATELREGQATACIVGGVDSYLDADILESLDRAGRFHSTRMRWGFTPGEAAGFCVIATAKTAAAFKARPLAEVNAVATEHESHLLDGQSVNTGRALAAAFRAVLGPHEHANHTYCDLNGETRRADEFALAISRAADRFIDVSGFTAGADRWGDVGAASGPLAWAQATAAWQRGYARGPVALTWASGADEPLRGAARLAPTRAWREG